MSVRVGVSVAPQVTAEQWRQAAIVLRQQAVEFDKRAEKADAAALGVMVCGVVSYCGPKGEPLACGWAPHSGGEHSWSTLPTWPVGGLGS